MAKHEVPLLTRAGLFALHAAGKVASLSIGAAYVSQPAQGFRAQRDIFTARPVFSGRAALVAHVFYPDLLPEILARWASLPEGAGLILTAPTDRVAAVSAALRTEALIVPVANRGRDVAPFINVLNSGALTGYDVVLKLHTKRSRHLRDGEIRRRLLFAALAGSRRRVQAVLRRSALSAVETAVTSFGAGRLVIDEVRHEATVSGVVVELTPTEWSLLTVLAYLWSAM